MEKKKKFLRILARVLAIVTALVCTLCMVVPSYADDTLTEQGTIIAEQAEKIETYISTLGYGNLQLTAGEQLEIQQKTYADVKSYAWFSSDYAPYNVLTTGINNDNRSNEAGGFTFTIMDSDGNIVHQRDWGTYSYTYSYDNANENRISIITSTGLQYRIKYDPTNNQWVSVHYRSASNASTLDYAMEDGYKFQGQAWSVSVDAFNTCAYCVINPSLLLSLNVSASNEEVYNQGFETGLREGYEVGYDAGVVEGWDAGHTEGYTNGLDQGYRDGYDDGMTQMSLIDLVTEIIRAPMTLIESTLNFDIFGINMSSAVKALVTMALLAVVVTIVWKAVK